MGTSAIRAFWQQLDSNVHPSDVPFFSEYPHSFNLDYPPPAFIGDVDNAPIVILMANGGYGPATPREFATEADRLGYISWLKGEEADVPPNLSSYYTAQKIFPCIKRGQVVIVNAVAYRSPKITQERDNQILARLLPSAAVHRKWLREELLPAAYGNRRLVMFHRWALWGVSRMEVRTCQNVHFSRCPRSPTLSHDGIKTLEGWLGTR